MACTPFIVKSVTAGTFSNVRSDLFGNFWRESPYKRKNILTWLTDLPGIPVGNVQAAFPEVFDRTASQRLVQRRSPGRGL